ncbi:non-LTR retrotransposon transposase, partial [Trifolium medium]|nr:non-LTR retrotransposon transposase [Trifolium medium]
WNGARLEMFKPQRGIRQGDPISPYLFVLCMDKLLHLIIHAVDEGKWKGIKAGRNGPMVSHLMFADDLLLFGEASENQTRCVMDILQQFCCMSGQQVSQEKTSVPLHGRAPKRSDFQYILDQVSAKLSTWKAKQLSFSGRVTLAKSVIEAIRIYPMMSLRIPKSCLEEIQRLQRQFIWGDTDQKRRYHAVGWDKVTVPK